MTPIPHTHRRLSVFLLHALIPLGFSSLVGWACYAVSGVSLGLFFGPILLVTFLVPSLALADEDPIARLVACGAVTLGIAAVWLISANLSLFDLLRCVGVFGAYVFALGGCAVLLSRVKIGSTYAAAIVVVAGFAWLTWPVWLSPWLYGSHAETIVHWLSAAHPLMAINGVLFERFNFWDRYTLSYQQLTTLNQDVFYTLPKTVIWMILVHGAFAAAGLAPSSRTLSGKLRQPRIGPAAIQ
ncbi:MAG TPA: hypothetical protein VG326_12075 [Tepidisphaeraceae bacterium]|nr:hypothetical protein [Tepidisphaeraceae bacterium]